MTPWCGTAFWRLTPPSFKSPSRRSPWRRRCGKCWARVSSELFTAVRPSANRQRRSASRPDLAAGVLDRPDAPALGEGVVQLLLRHSAWPLRARLLVAEAEQEQPTVPLQ